MRAALLVVALLVAGISCKAWLDKHDPPTCPPSDPNCTCLDPHRHIGCVDNWTDQIDPAVVGPVQNLARDGGVDGDVGGER